MQGQPGLQQINKVIKMAKSKLHVPRWLGGAMVAAWLAASAHAQSFYVVNITATFTYTGGNTVIGGIPFTNGAAVSQLFSLYFDAATGVYSQSQTALGTATETITIGSSVFDYSLSSVALGYGHGTSQGGYTEFNLSAGAPSNPLYFGFDIYENTNLFSGGGNASSLTISDLGPILTTFQNAINDGNNPTMLNVNYTYPFANGQDIQSIFNGTGTLQPSAFALTGMGVRTNQFGFNITNVIGASSVPFVVEASANLSSPNWQPLQTNTGSVYFSDPQWTNYPTRFYRIRSP